MVNFLSWLEHQDSRDCVCLRLMISLVTPNYLFLGKMEIAPLSQFHDNVLGTSPGQVSEKNKQVKQVSVDKKHYMYY